jgi:hypothetical protein
VIAKDRLLVQVSEPINVPEQQIVAYAESNRAWVKIWGPWSQEIDDIVRGLVRGDAVEPIYQRFHGGMFFPEPTMGYHALMESKLTRMHA